MHVQHIYPLVNQRSYGKWPMEIVDLPSKNGGFLNLFLVYQRDIYYSIYNIYSTNVYNLLNRYSMCHPWGLMTSSADIEQYLE